MQARFRGARISSLPIMINAYSTGWYQGVLKYMGYKLFDMCRCEGNGFQAIKSGIGYFLLEIREFLPFWLVAYEHFYCTLNTYSLL